MYYWISLTTLLIWLVRSVHRTHGFTLCAEGSVGCPQNIPSCSNGTNSFVLDLDCDISDGVIYLVVADSVMGTMVDDTDRCNVNDSHKLCSFSSYEWSTAVNNCLWQKSSCSLKDTDEQMYCSYSSPDYYYDSASQIAYNTLVAVNARCVEETKIRDISSKHKYIYTDHGYIVSPGYPALPNIGTKYNQTITNNGFFSNITLHFKVFNLAVASDCKEGGDHLIISYKEYSTAKNVEMDFCGNITHGLTTHILAYEVNLRYQKYEPALVGVFEIMFEVHNVTEPKVTEATAFEFQASTSEIAAASNHLDIIIVSSTVVSLLVLIIAAVTLLIKQYIKRKTEDTLPQNRSQSIEQSAQDDTELIMMLPHREKKDKLVNAQKETVLQNGSFVTPLRNDISHLDGHTPKDKIVPNGCHKIDESNFIFTSEFLKQPKQEFESSKQPKIEDTVSIIGCEL